MCITFRRMLNSANGVWCGWNAGGNANFYFRIRNSAMRTVPSFAVLQTQLAFSWLRVSSIIACVWHKVTVGSPIKIITSIHLLTVELPVWYMHIMRHANHPPSPPSSEDNSSCDDATESGAILNNLSPPLFILPVGPADRDWVKCRPPGKCHIVQ